MIDARLVPHIDRLLGPLARFLSSRGVAADHITLTGFFVGTLAVPAIALGWWSLALVVIVINRFCDGLDGAVARASKPTERGAFLDIALDFVFYALIPLGFALNAPVINSLPAAVLLAAFLGTGSSFLAFAVIAAKRGERALKFPTKGIYYLGGLTEGFETILLFVLMCMFPTSFPILAYGFAAACAVTTILRWRQGWVAFG